jgi:polygalacturonase
VSAETQPDRDITVEGGIWTTLATSAKESNGNLRGSSAGKNAVPGTHGVILLQNVRGVTVRNITVRQSRAFAVHLANVEDFTVDGLTLENHRRDGVHVNGPARRGLIRNVSGDSHDDTVALNAWEWKNYAPSYGAIHDIVIEDISGAPEGIPSANSIRFLPGKKKFADGTLLDCPIHDITVRRVAGITEFKLYDQPNLELGRDKDFSAGLGTLRNLRFEHLDLPRAARIEIHAELDGLVLDQVVLEENEPFILIGPKSQTWRFGDDHSKWVEIFSPDLDCSARNISISSVRVRGEENELAPEQFVREIEQTMNHKYPATTPRGGTGKGTWVR